MKSYQSVLEKIKSEITHHRSDLSPETVVKILKDAQDLNEGFLEYLPQILAEETLPRQTFSGKSFSQFPLTLFNHEGYNLDLYFWKGSHTSIHDHHFSGAFKILKGAYHQLTYSFEGRISPLPTLTIGELTQIKTETLRYPDVRPIDQGRNFIHMTHHGSSECVTACLRSELNTGDIHSYFPPSIRITSGKMTFKDSKLMDYLNYLVVNENASVERVSKVLEEFSEGFLLQLVFGFNLPSWINKTGFQEVGQKLLASRFGTEKWFEEIPKALRASTIFRKKLSLLS